MAPVTFGPSPSSSSDQLDSDVVEIRVEVRDGTGRPSVRRVEVQQGEQVRLTVTSDVDDEVHVHGVDVEKRLRAGQPADLQFRVRQPGIFPVETHEEGLELLQLEVR